MIISGRINPFRANWLSSVLNNHRKNYLKHDTVAFLAA